MMIRFQLEGLPPSMNQLRGKIRQKIQTEGEYHRRVWAELFGSFHGIPLGGPSEFIRAEIAYLFGPRQQRSDTLSNREKLLLDAIKGAGIIDDDIWIKIGEVASAPAKESRTLVKLFPIVPITEEQIWQWYNAPDPHMELHMGRMQ